MTVCNSYVFKSMAFLKSLYLAPLACKFPTVAPTWRSEQGGIVPWEYSWKLFLFLKT